MIGYRVRWLIETFHKTVKMFMGFEDIASHSFGSVRSHVHLVYCAYILFNLNPPGVERPDIPIADLGIFTLFLHIFLDIKLTFYQL